MTTGHPVVFSPQALAAFKTFCEIDRTTRQRPPPTIAMDASGRELKRALAKDETPRRQATVSTATMVDESSRAVKGELIGLLRELLSPAEVDQVLAAISNCFPEGFEGASDEDEDAGGVPFDPSRRRPARMNNDPWPTTMGGNDDSYTPPYTPGPRPFKGMPKPGGSMVSQDRQLAMDAAERIEASRADYVSRFGREGTGRELSLVHPRRYTV
jgi:hypothetical protein